MRSLTRISSIDLNDNPFCLDRRRNEERHLIQLNRNPSLMKLTPADQRRSASFTRDPKKLQIDLARRKRCLLVSSLRAASASQRKMRESSGIGDTVVQPGIACMDADNFFDSKEIAGRRRDVDIDTMADLEPYRREILMQRPTTFGHRPNSASRMFSLSMATSSGGRKMGLRSRHTKEKGEARRALGLSASMLKELLSSRGVKASTSTTQGGASDGLVGRQDSPHSSRLERSVSSSDAINPLENSLRDASASRSSQVRMGNRVTVQSELRRIFSDCPSWDDTPAPTPKTRDVRRGISLMAMPDPNERLRDKLAKSRKLAAGVPVIASSIQEEKSNTQAGRWETPPTTPRTFIAGQELRRLVKTRRKRDEVMARRVQRAEKSVLYNKISPSEELYQQTLAQGMGIKSRGLT